jgi:hypothetical protein
VRSFGRSDVFAGKQFGYVLPAIWAFINLVRTLYVPLESLSDTCLSDCRDLKHYLLLSVFVRLPRLCDLPINSNVGLRTALSVFPSLM